MESQSTELPLSVANGSAALLRMFTFMPRAIEPMSADMFPIQTEYVRTREGKNERQSPALWYDTLTPQQIRWTPPPRPGLQPPVEIIHQLTTMHSKNVTVQPYIRSVMEAPRLTAYGQWIRGLLENPISTPSAITTSKLVVSKFACRSRLIAATLATVSVDQQSFVEEAALVRCGLMIMTCQSGAFYRQTSSSVTQLAIDKSCTDASFNVDWGDVGLGRNIPAADGTSELHLITFDQYVLLIYGQARDVNFDRGVIVPVEASWSGARWVLPYIISFTTTRWWNHNIRHDFRTINDAGDDGELAGHMINEASTAIVDGSYEHIYLVIFDEQSSDRAGDTPFDYWHGEIVSLNQTNNNFAAHVYESLGRVQGVEGATQYQRVQAFERLSIEVSLPGTEERALAMIAELSTRRYAGAGIWQGNAAAPAGKEGTVGVFAFDHDINVRGVTANNCWRWDANPLWNQCGHKLQAQRDWRVSPLGFFPQSAVYIGTGVPYLGDHRCVQSTYQVAAASPSVRILLAMGIFDRDTSCRHRFRNGIDFGHYVLSSASLIGAISQWQMLAVGTNGLDMSGWTSYSQDLPHEYRKLPTRVTDGFVASCATLPGRYVNIMEVEATFTDVFPGCTLDNWMGLPLPWWYIGAVIDKFGLRYSSDKGTDVARLNAHVRCGYVFNQSSKWYEPAIATSDMSYNSHRFRIFAMHGNNEEYGLDYIPVWFDGIIDGKRQRQQDGKPYPIDVSYYARTQTLAMGLLFGRYCTTRRMPQMFVDRTAPCMLSEPRSWLRVQGGLKWPDPFWDWLWNGITTVVDPLVKGNIPEPIGSGISYVSEPGANWASDKISSWNNNTFRSQPY